MQAFDAATAAGSAPAMWLAAPYSGAAPAPWAGPSLTRPALQRLLACARRSVDALQVSQLSYWPLVLHVPLLVLRP